MSRIGGKIKEMRLAKGLTPKQLAKAMGVSESFIFEVESGKKVLGDELITRASKILGQAINDMTVLGADEKQGQASKSVKSSVELKKAVPEEVKEFWNEAFGSVLKAIPIYEYDLVKVLDSKQLPIISNKVEGHAKDKVIYIKIQDNDMTGFRMAQSDLVLAYLTNEVENNAICLVELDGRRMVRQIKKLDSGNILLVGNNGILNTETATVKSIKVLAKLVRVEIVL